MATTLAFCRNCGKSFTPTRKSAGLYCSPACYHERRTRAPADRLWEKVEKTDACWLWTGYMNDSGYGILEISDRPVRVHRLSYELANGPIPKGLHVLHRCDTPRCVNPAHLFVGTDADNHVDKAKKGRIPYARLTPDDVREIRRLAASGVTHRAIAARYGFTRNGISLIVNRKNWAHVE